MLHKSLPEKIVKKHPSKMQIKFNRAKVLDVLEEIERFSQSSDSFQIHFEFFKNFNSEQTRLAYHSDLKHFFFFFRSAFKTPLRHPKQVNRFHIVAYKEFLTKAGGIDDQPSAPKSIGRKLGCLNSYFKFLMEKGIIATNPVDGVKRPKQEVINPTFDLSDEQIKALLNLILPIDLQSSLYRAILFVLFGTGIRVSELINLKLKDYDQLQKFKILKFKAKGGKQRMVPLKQEVYLAIDQYLEYMKMNGRIIYKDDFLFQPTRNNSNGILNKPIHRVTIFKLIKKLCFQAMIHQKVSPHSARASVISSLLAKGVDLYKVSLSVGHSNPKTTKLYDKRSKSINDSALLDLDYLS